VHKRLCAHRSYRFHEAGWETRRQHCLSVFIRLIQLVLSEALPAEVCFAEVRPVEVCPAEVCFAYRA
jgi:hypothetical protein